MKDLITKAIIVDKPPKFYKDRELTRPLTISLPRDSEYEIGEVEGNAVKVILPDRTEAYIHGEEQIVLVQPAWAIEETKVYDRPDEDASFPTILKKGDAFELLNLLEDTNEQWLRVKLPDKQIKYMRGNVIVMTQDGIIEDMGKMMGEGQSEESIVKEFTKQGAPEQLVRDFYTEIARLAEEYRNSPEGKKNISSQASKRILYGLLWAAGGAIATFAGMEAASGGGTYFVFWGAIVYGGFLIIRGIFELVKR